MTVTTELKICINFNEIQRLMDIRDLPSRNALARRAGIHGQHLYQIFSEKVAPSLPTIARLCFALRCEPGDILYYDPEGDEELESGAGE